MLKNSQLYLKHQIEYLRQFIKSPRTFGSLAPSSPWLCNRMVEQADWKKSITVAELGAGNGILTRHLLNRLIPNAQLDAYEIQSDLSMQLKELAGNDKRLHVITCSAEELIRNYDVIFSCIPLISIPIMVRMRILRQIRLRLNPGGIMIQFQYSTLSEKSLSRYFKWSKVYEILNFPPAWVYIFVPKCDTVTKSHMWIA